MSMIERVEVGPRMSQVVKAGGLAFVAGQTARDQQGGIADQTALVLARIDDLLAAAGMDRAALVSATVWLADIREFDVMNTVWEAWVTPGAPPARACVEAKMARPTCRVEIAAVAALSETTA